MAGGDEGEKKECGCLMYWKDEVAGDGGW